jgi:uncharacterized membrane protein YuzA (DUF378 family)
MAPKTADARVGRAAGTPGQEGGDTNRPIAVAIPSLIIILALVCGVGIPDKLVLRHVVQTLPLWAGVILGFRRSRLAGWTALPSFLFWLALMTLIWLFLLGVTRAVTGTFTPLETAMTILVGLACLWGIAIFATSKSRVSPITAATLFVIFAALQFACFRASLLPPIAHR